MDLGGGVRDGGDACESGDAREDGGGIDRGKDGGREG
jgi:hypothetical protein